MLQKRKPERDGGRRRNSPIGAVFCFPGNVYLVGLPQTWWIPKLKPHSTNSGTSYSEECILGVEGRQNLKI